MLRNVVNTSCTNYDAMRNVGSKVRGVGNPIGDWIKAERKRHGWKVEELSRRLVDAGYEGEVNTVRVWESPKGRQPKADTITALERLFGASAPRESETTNADLASAVRELVEEVRLSRLSQERNADVLAELLGVVLAGRLPQPGTEGAAVVPVPRDTE